MKATPSAARVQPLPADGLHEYMGLLSAKGYGGYWSRGQTVQDVRKGMKHWTSDTRRMRIVIVPKGAKLDEVNGQWMTWPDNGHPDAACPSCTFQNKRK